MMNRLEQYSKSLLLCLGIILGELNSVIRFHFSGLYDQPRSLTNATCCFSYVITKTPCVPTPVNVVVVGCRSQRYKGCRLQRHRKQSKFTELQSHFLKSYFSSRIFCRHPESSNNLKLKFGLSGKICGNQGSGLI